jgi:lysophospholipase L1-like esterase
MTTSVQVRAVRRLAVLATGVLTLLGSTFVVSPAGSARPADEHGHRHGRYLALGDSVPFGYRPPAVTPPADYLDAATFVGYPQVAARRLHTRLTNASCPGETTASMVTAGAQSNGCENSLTSPVGYRTLFPLHTAYRGTQLAYAVRYLRHHRHTRLVSLTIGANDLLVCLQTTADLCTGSDLVTTVARVERNVGHILGALRRAPYHHRLVVVTYYSPDYADPAKTRPVRAMDAALVRAAHAHHAVVADGFRAFAEAAKDVGGDSCVAGLLVALPIGGCNVHPSPKGHRLLARAVVRAAHR